MHSRSTVLIFPSTGTFSSKVSMPEIVITSVTGGALASESTRSDRPPRLRYSKGSFSIPARRSSTRTFRPGTMKQVRATRAQIVSKSMDAWGSKTSRSGQNLILVPVLRVDLTLASVCEALNPPFGSNWPATRSRKQSRWVLPPRSTSAVSFEERALTTEAPTP